MDRVALRMLFRDDGRFRSTATSVLFILMKQSTSAGCRNSVASRLSASQGLTASVLLCVARCWHATSNVYLWGRAVEVERCFGVSDVRYGRRPSRVLYGKICRKKLVQPWNMVRGARYWVVPHFTRYLVPV